MKTVAVIISCDTKYKEAALIKESLSSMGVESIVVDTSIGKEEPSNYDISRLDVIKSINRMWIDVKDKTKSELISLMTEAAVVTIKKLYDDGTIHGVMSAGGMQNTIIATAAMRALPIGVPKVMATTVASGNRTFGQFADRKDIVFIPSIADFSGINAITSTIIKNACACCAGMVKYAGKTPEKKKLSVGVSLMGVTGIGCNSAMEELERQGYEVIGFHATGVGGATMEFLAHEGVLDAILDLTTHELTCEYFKKGFSYSEFKRLETAAKMEIPLVISVGGLDFIDISDFESFTDIENRKYIYHNPTIKHIKVTPEEAYEIGRLLAGRLNLAAERAVLLLPTNGMRSETKEGEALCCKQTDTMLIKGILDNVCSQIEIIHIDGNLNDAEWGKKAASIMVEQLRKKYKETYCGSD